MKIREETYNLDRPRDTYYPKLIVQEKAGRRGKGQRVITDACSGFKDGDEILAFKGPKRDWETLQPGHALCMLGKFGYDRSTKWLLRPPFVIDFPKLEIVGHYPSVVAVILPNKSYVWNYTHWSREIMDDLMTTYMALYNRC